MAGNARRHGATARPDPARIAVWLRVILAVPYIELADVLQNGDLGYQALALAEAEVRYGMAEQALREFEVDLRSPPDDIQALESQSLGIQEILDEYEMSVRERRKGLAIMARMGEYIARQQASAVSRHRLLNRYLAEARARRNKAFAAWISYLEGERYRREVA